MSLPRASSSLNATFGEPFLGLDAGSTSGVWKVMVFSQTKLRLGYDSVTSDREAGEPQMARGPYKKTK